MWQGDAVRLTFLATLTVALALGACSAPAAVAPAAPPADAATAETWRTATLLDVLTADEFSIDDFGGKVVVIEPMAIWCINCRFQQSEAQQALVELASDDVVYLSLDVDPRERPDDLSAYARREGFDWRFAVASTAVSRALAETFGDQVLSPPATPLIVLGPDGRVVAHLFGAKSASDLVALLRPHLP